MPKRKTEQYKHAYRIARAVQVMSTYLHTKKKRIKVNLPLDLTNAGLTVASCERDGYTMDRDKISGLQMADLVRLEITIFLIQSCVSNTFVDSRSCIEY